MTSMSARRFVACALACALAAPGPVALAWPAAADPAAVAQAEEGDVAAFRRLRAEGLAAAAAGDLDLAAARLAEADLRIDNHPGLIQLRARIAAARGQTDEALRLVRRYAATGLVFNLERDRALSALAGAPGHAEAAAALAANLAPVGEGRLSSMARLEGPVIAEGLVRDAARGRWLVSQVRGRAIVALADDGVVTPLLAGDASIGAAIGLALDPGTDSLWATTAPLAPAVHGLPEGAARPEPALLQLDAATGAVRARFGAPAGVTDFDPGDLLLAADGALYVADSTGGAIYRLPSGGTSLEVWVPAGQLGSPQGMVTTTDGAALIVADYSSGLWRIDRRSGAAIRLPAPAEASLIGLDGLVADGTVLYAIQNGAMPQRILRLTLAADASGVATVEVLAANLPQLDAPTTGLVHDGELVFVARSQWSDFTADGAQATPDPAPAILARLALH
ncbi:MAG TPA: hypothetical protein VGN74_14065 [Brevundimonas sp.]|uniref:hypothetical protein n=1 Tax=Brevundimonas sp. TaxID=1871086 RepID=UPI002E11A934|nr:hypothetical protein [Brevundimonas sp.]